jgi:hypothetical protein
MNSTASTRSAAVAAGLLAALVLTACGSDPSRTGSTDGTIPGAQSRSVSDGGNPREHLAYRDLAAARGGDSNPFEHLGHRGSADDGR